MDTYEVGYFNTNNEYEEHIFNSTENIISQKNLMKTMDLNLSDDEEFAIETNLLNGIVFDHDDTVHESGVNTNENLMSGYEIIAVDPNCFYSSDEDADVDVELDEDDEDNIALSFNEMTKLNSIPIAIPKANENFDQPQRSTDGSFEINLNIDETVLLGHDHILFAEDKSELGQFDLASYIAGDASSILLSPPPPIGQRPIFIEQKTEEAKPTQNGTNGRRKRRNLTKMFVETDDSDSESEKRKSEMVNEKLKKSKKDDDPNWNPQPVTAVKSKAEITVKKNDLSKTQKTKPAPVVTAANNQTNGLRSMLKKQLLSGRSMNSSKLTKMMATKGDLKQSTSSSIAINTISSGSKCIERKQVGLGRGKQISFTAKHFDLTDSSDNSERDSESELDETDVQVKQEKPSESKISEEKEEMKTVEHKNVDENSDESNSSGKISIKSHVSHQSAPTSIAPPSSSSSSSNQTAKSKTSSAAGTVTLIDNTSLDNNDFAKAIFVDVKNTAKSKSNPALNQKKPIVDKRKPLISAPLYTNGARFKTNLLNRSISSTVASRPFANLNANQSQNKSKFAKAKSENDINERQKSTIEQGVEQHKEEMIKIEEISNDGDDSKSSEIDVVTVDEAKNESSTKKKLNIQEYLKRKNMSASTSAALGGGKIKCQVNLSAKGEQEKNESKSSESKDQKSSIYEEIIVVSMGCCTDISIPELAFGTKTEAIDRSNGTSKSKALLSDIQTTIVRANSAIEQGKISSNSLISSIQNVLLTKTSTQTAVSTPTTESGDEKTEKSTETEEKKVKEHGENKVIMHLRKDRIRPVTKTISIQTEPYFQFPPLQRLSPHNSRSRSISKGRSDAGHGESMRMQRLHRQHKEIVESSYYSEEDQSPSERRSRHSDFFSRTSCESNNRLDASKRRHNRSKSHRRSYNRNRTISRSLSRSSDSSISSTNSSSSAASSSSSSSSGSSKTLNSYGDSSSKSYYDDDQYNRNRRRSCYGNRSQSRNRPSSHRSNSPEERRIVYVGRIEPEKTKEDLRKIFTIFGHVVNVSIHYKEMKWKYGFVTFARPADAYKAIDSSANYPETRDYDISFGGRRAFCRDKYLDLDDLSQPSSKLSKKQAEAEEEDSFEALLRKVKQKMQGAKQ